MRVIYIFLITCFLANLAFSADEFDIREITGVHGANSGVLVGLRRTCGVMHPTGVLNEMGIVPLSGELWTGVGSATGVNKKKISFAPTSKFDMALRYANGFNVKDIDYAAHLRDYLSQLSLAEAFILRGDDESMRTQIKDNFSSFCQSARICNDMSCSCGFCGRYAQANNTLVRNITFSGIPYTIMRLRSTQPGTHEELIRAVKNNAEIALEEFASFLKTPYGKEKFASNSRDGWLLESYEYRARSILDACEKDLTPFSPEELAVTRDPFPIVFATNSTNFKPYSTAELEFDGSLTLGKDIPYIFVPANRVDFMRSWIMTNVPGTKPSVFSIESWEQLTTVQA